MTDRYKPLEDVHVNNWCEWTPISVEGRAGRELRNSRHMMAEVDRIANLDDLDSSWRIAQIKNLLVDNRREPPCPNPHPFGVPYPHESHILAVDGVHTLRRTCGYCGEDFYDQIGVDMKPITTNYADHFEAPA